jgi:cytochrome c peroxidase
MGDKDALSAEELVGYQLFKNSGCVACHNGPAVGGNSFQKMGVVEPYQAKSPAEGRAAVTGKDADRFKFKVPTLRNVEPTYPYFHDGEAETLTGDQPLFHFPMLPPSTDKTPRPKPFD